ncbi:B12-binding domain-containing radical SAM protein [Candidatus Margulisiibacteriota bacterium]
MKIVFINPCFNVYAGIKGHGGLSAPLNLAYLAAYIRKKRPKDQITIIDAEALNYTYEDTVKQILAHNPDLIGITTTTPSFDIVTKLVIKIREVIPDVPIILGGPHATGSPETTVAVPGVTAAVIGEGEETLLEIINNVEHHLPLIYIKGIAYRGSDGELIKTDLREPIKDLDSLPSPARDLLPMKLYYSPPTKSLGGSQIANIVTSRGCPFNCTFCLSSMMWGKKCRQRSVNKIIEEIEECIDKYNCDEINFNDDLFTADKNRVKEFCSQMIKKNIKVNWVVMSRSDYITTDLLASMKEAGCKKIAIGFESGSPIVLKHMNKRLAPNRSLEAAKLIKKSGIALGAAFVIGHIGETPQTIKETIAFAKKINPDTVAFFQASPYPGTDFYKMAKQLGYLNQDAKWIDYAIVSNKPSVVNLPGLSAEAISRWVKYAYRSFYLTPSYIYMRLRQVRSWRTLLENLKGLKILFAIISSNLIVFQNKNKVKQGRTKKHNDA